MSRPPVGDSVPRFIKAAFEYWPQVLNALIGTIGLTLVGIFLGADGEWHGIAKKTIGYWGLGVCLVGTVGLTLVTFLRERTANEQLATLGRELIGKSGRISELEGENDELRGDYVELVNDQLGLVFYKLNLNHQHRISVYKHESAANQFVILGRYTPNPEHKKQRRRSYPETEGFIMKAWQEGELIVKNLPDPANKGKYYKAVSQISPIAREVVDAIRMKSRCFYGKAVRTKDTMTSVAVVIVEGLDADGLDTDALSDWFNDGGEQTLCLFVQRLKSNVVQVDGQLASLNGL